MVVWFWIVVGAKAKSWARLQGEFAQGSYMTACDDVWRKKVRVVFGRVI